jgi:hypothetical protein
MMPDNKLWIYKKPENEADGMPTAIQELVLCKNCIKRKSDKCLLYWNEIMDDETWNDDWFCADGRRVDNDA